MIKELGEVRCNQKSYVSLLLAASLTSIITIYGTSFMQYAHTLLLLESDPYYIWEKRWLNKPDTMARYMRAAKWNFEDAKKRIKGTVEWRREYKPDLIPPDEVCHFGHSLGRAWIDVTTTTRLKLRMRLAKCMYLLYSVAWYSWSFILQLDQRVR